MKRFLLLSIFSLLTFTNYSQSQAPKLVIGVVVDQMRYDYLTKYAERFGENGFKKLINEGFLLKNAHFSYVPTYTAVGHSSIYTGTTPSHHGIIGNNWYDKYLKKSIYCVDDARYETIGVNNKSGQKSPYRLVSTTVTDQLQLAQNMRGKVISLAIKDRSAILPGGHTANGAYWYEGGNHNKWITSSYYMDKLPKWVQKFNKQNNADKYLSKPWNTLYPIETYINSREDNNAFEGTFKGEKTPTFPHNLPDLRKENGNYSLIKSTPFGNKLTLDFAKAAIKGENLGKSDFIDFLAISLSSPDYIGHQYGPDAIEVEDNYLRLDKELGEFINYLNKEVGKGNYTLFLTADHGAVRVPAYLKSLKIPAGYISHSKLTKFISNKLEYKFGLDNLIEKISNFQIFLNHDIIDQSNLDKNKINYFIAEQVIKFEGIYKAVTSRTLQNSEFSEGILANIQRGYNQKLSGDVILVPYPGIIHTRKTGTTHGSGYSYDTHIPIIFYGNGIKKGSTVKKYNIRDIAPTISQLLGIEQPNATTGKVAKEALKL